MKILVTGAAGFIGAAVSKALLTRNNNDVVIGIDNLNDYYDVNLKQARLAELESEAHFEFTRLDIADRKQVADYFERENPQRVIHLAAQAGVRYSITHPHAYADSNLLGFMNILEGCRQHAIEHLVYASSSSVYGANTHIPFSVHDNIDHPVSLYAATKKANELMAHTYSHLYGLPTTGLRFFTVYGPWGRPDMSYFSFTKKILAGEAIDVFNYGNHRRDFTYIDDIVNGLLKIIDKPAAGNDDWTSEQPDPASSKAPYRIYNIGNHQPVPLLDFISILETLLDKPALKNLLPMQPGDVLETYADITALNNDFGYYPSTDIEQGLAKFVQWYKTYYQNYA